MNHKCWYEHKKFYLLRMVKLKTDQLDAIHKCLSEAPPPVSLIMSAVVTKRFEIEARKIKSCIISGPICGSRIVKDGFVVGPEL